MLFPTVLEVGLQILYLGLECVDIVFEGFEVLLGTSLLGRLLSPCALYFVY